MKSLSVKLVLQAFLALSALVASMGLLPSPGTVDVPTFEKWAHHADVSGLAGGYRANEGDYPPFTSVILLGAVRGSRLFGMQMFPAIKLSIFLFLLLATVLFYLWTRDFLIALIFYVSLLLNTVALGYVDIYFAPTLILSLWALKQQRLAWFAVFYAVACLTKWQPLIMAPFIALYLIEIRQVNQWKQIRLGLLAREVIAPAGAVLVLTGLVFGVDQLSAAIQQAFGDPFLSGYALNFNWILTHILHVLHPETAGVVVNELDNLVLVNSLPAWSVTLPKMLFVLFYIIALAAFFKRDKTYENLIKYSVLGYFSYFTFNTGVHENHLFVAVLLSLILLWLDRKYVLWMLALVVLMNINLFMFYGIDGRGLGVDRLFGEIVTLTFLLSFLSVGLFLALLAANVLNS